MNCPVCRTQMKPLFTGEFCPNDCDRKPKFKPLSLESLRSKITIESGFIWAPYTPVIKCAPPVHYFDRNKLLTRYAKATIRPEYYGTVTVKDIK